MPAYVIAEVEIHDPETYARYRARTPELVARHGGRFLVRGGAAELLEGEEEPKRVVVIAFDDMEAARRFYHSPEYREIAVLRQKAARTRMILVEGVAEEG